MGNYRVVTAAAEKEREKTGVLQGGTEIIISEITKQYVTKIAIQSSSVDRATIVRKNSNIHIQILTSYAPNNEHTEEDRMHHWGEVKEITKKTCKR